MAQVQCTSIQVRVQVHRPTMKMKLRFMKVGYRSHTHI